MNDILGTAKTVRELLKGVKYSIDYYQREYKWQDKQVRELVDDLVGKFLEGYEEGHARKRVAEYPRYFLGSIIVSRKDTQSYIVDGQQRLTTLTLLLVLLRHLQTELDESDRVNVDELIVSTKYGERSFNLDINERRSVMESLFDGRTFDINGRSESVQNLVARYGDVGEALPEEIRGAALPYFADWILDNVHLVEITAFSDDDAYTIFETMNDRGLSLTPTDMLKGYLLANIDSEPKRHDANGLWRRRVSKMDEAGKDVESDFFKNWLRSQYAAKIRERRRGAKPQDFDRIGTEFHRWLRERSREIGLTESDRFVDFIVRNFDYYSRQYLRIVEASRNRVTGLEPIFYNADHGFTLQNMLLLAPLLPDDPEDVCLKKLGLVARFVDILITWRIWNFRSIAYSTMQYAMFLTMRDIRGTAPQELADKLRDRLLSETENFDGPVRLFMHQQNRRQLHRLLARITDYIETQSEMPPRYQEYVQEGPNRYEVEHVWANHPERHLDEFPHESDFREYRNRIGGLLLLPKKFNAAYGDLPYASKLKHYNTQNLLARSLHPLAYERNPGFMRFVESSGLPFEPHPEFRRVDLDQRGDLYRRVAHRLWDPGEL